MNTAAQPSDATDSQAKAPHKSARRRAREFAVQGIYQWQLSGDTVTRIETFLRESSPYFHKADEKLFREVFYGAVKQADELQIGFTPCLDRSIEEISPVEKAVLLMGTFELLHKPETPYAVIINECIEIAKTFGGTDGHKFVNGVLDKLALRVRQDEVEAARAKRRG
ncbi:transcription antitermination factor NusB [Parachitinimonas caeni]|uniref:Transcription antitermination protein NusB n=1 Tax=Parachitinimonas caeni TaxID=3031301 RepID=A0ABT7DTR0_9NEIS|nr:transcription antitermination factor NusB [Parachitinimonas caeni]MDK2123453.1 transcription antitermination factor NusB [Parachitinimonas caeni]